MNIHINIWILQRIKLRRHNVLTQNHQPWGHNDTLGKGEHEQSVELWKWKDSTHKLHHAATTTSKHLSWCVDSCHHDTAQPSPCCCSSSPQQQGDTCRVKMAAWSGGGVISLQERVSPAGRWKLLPLFVCLFLFNYRFYIINCYKSTISTAPFLTILLSYVVISLVSHTHNNLAG